MTDRMIEPKVGETITVKGKDYRCVQNGDKRIGCMKCDLLFHGCSDVEFECRSIIREDHNSVYFKEVP